MSKEKDESPLSPNPPREFERGTGKLTEKVRRHTSTKREDLLTSSDLFGDIIDELREDRSESPGAPGRASASIDSKSQNGSPVPDTSRPVPVIRPDTISVNPDSTESFGPSGGPESTAPLPKEQYSLVDLAYSTLLQDSKLGDSMDPLVSSETEK